MKKYLLKILLPDAKLWDMAGMIASRFTDMDDGAYDDLQEKLYNWIKFGIYN
jgi:hypothetical protein